MPSHRFLDHTSEVRLEIRADTLAGLLAEAARAFGALERRGAPGRPEPGWRAHAVESADRESLLVDWLNELVFLAERERYVPEVVEVRSASDTGLEARSRGAVLDTTPGLVKAATHHGLTVRRTGDGWEAVVVLDV